MSDKNYMTDAAGRLVPIESVKPQEKLENDFVLALFELAMLLNKELTSFKARAFGDSDAFMELMAEKYGVKMGGKKGNVTFVSYDGLTKVQISNQEFIEFGATLQVAKQLLDEFIKDQADGIGADLKTFIFNAFDVDREGRVNRAEILGLRRYNIKHPTWLKAMEAINDSIRVASTKRYIRFYRRETPEAEFQAVSLDLAKV